MLTIDSYSYYFGSYEGPSAIFSNYLDQGLVVNSTNWQKLLNAAAEDNVWLVFGFAQLEGDYIYMAQAMIDSDGQVVQIRHKLRPSGTERTMFSDGMTDMLQVHQTAFGRVGMLQCWEFVILPLSLCGSLADIAPRHMWPSEIFAMHSQVENIHVASFPWAPDLGVDTGVTRAEVSIAGARLYAVTGSTWVLMPAVGTSVIIAPNGTIVAQVEASDCPVAQPMIYHSINTIAFAGTPDHQADGEYSYAALKQVNAAFPAAIPHDKGIYISYRENSIQEMRRVGPLPLPYA